MLVAFDDSAVANALGQDALVSAKLEVTLTLPAVTFGSPQLAVHRMTADWNEYTASWSSVIGLFGNGAFQDPATCQIDVALGQVGTLSCDVTEDVFAMIAGTAENHGWMIKEESVADGATVHVGTRESVTPPRLILELGASETQDVVSVDVSTPGEIVVNASGGHGFLDVPAHGMTFTDEQAAIQWAIANLNATPVVDANGNTVGVQGRQRQSGSIYYLDDNLSVVESKDYVTTVLGGQDGYLTIAGQSYCIREEGCDVTLKAAPPSSVSRCDGSGNFCSDANSYKTNFLGIFRSIGSEVEQTKGGYEEHGYLCFKWFVPWICTRRHGSNELTVNNTYRWSVPGVFGTFAAGDSETNTESLSVKEWSLFTTLKFNSGGIAGGGGTISTAEAEISGVCGGETARDGDGTPFLFSATSKGTVTDVCDNSDPVLF